MKVLLTLDSIFYTALYLQLSRIRLHFCTSVGNFCKYMRHDATTNNLEKAITI